MPAHNLAAAQETASGWLNVSGFELKWTFQALAPPVGLIVVATS
jgi:hypothetical protein